MEIQKHTQNRKNLEIGADLSRFAMMPHCISLDPKRQPSNSDNSTKTPETSADLKQPQASGKTQTTSATPKTKTTHKAAANTSNASNLSKHEDSKPHKNSSRRQKSKDLFAAKHPEINQDYFRDFTCALLLNLYPRKCPKCGGTEFKAISTRETALRCVNPRCKAHTSLTSFTPAHSLRIPLWAFGWMFTEAVQLHPQPLTTSHICRKLGVGRNTGTLLKRRLQTLCSDLIPVVREMMKDAINADFPEDFELPARGEDVTEHVKGRAAVHSDVQALFLVTRKTNNYRTRYRNVGSTSSIYLSDKTAEERGFCQVGTLVHTLSIPKGPAIFTSIKDQSQEVVEPLFGWLPEQTPLFTDQGFPYLSRSVFNNYRYVNHSKRAKNQKRNVWGKNRFAENGVSNNAAEGIQRILKTSMKAYTYVRPKYGQLYLNEFSLLKAVRVYGLQAVVAKAREMREAGWRIGNVAELGLVDTSA